jgi:hypothetical protein
MQTCRHCLSPELPDAATHCRHCGRRLKPSKAPLTIGLVIAGLILIYRDLYILLPRHKLMKTGLIKYLTSLG